MNFKTNINYFTVSESLFVLFSALSSLWTKWKQENIWRLCPNPHHGSPEAQPIFNIRSSSFRGFSLSHNYKPPKKPSREKSIFTALSLLQIKTVKVLFSFLHISEEKKYCKDFNISSAIFQKFHIFPLLGGNMKL